MFEGCRALSQVLAGQCCQMLHRELCETCLQWHCKKSYISEKVVDHIQWKLEYAEPASLMSCFGGSSINTGRSLFRFVMGWYFWSLWFCHLDATLCYEQGSASDSTQLRTIKYILINIWSTCYIIPVDNYIPYLEIIMMWLIFRINTAHCLWKPTKFCW